MSSPRGPARTSARLGDFAGAARRGKPGADRAFHLYRVNGRERELGWMCRQPPPVRLLRAADGVVDYVIGEPLHFATVRTMILGLKDRAEQADASSPDTPGQPAA